MISQCLSLNMPRLNQSQRIQALTMLALCDVSNISRAFGCHRNTIIQLRQRFQQTGGVADRCRPGIPRVTNPRMDRFITLTHLRCGFQTATSSARQYGISKQTVLCHLRQARQPIRPRRPYVGQVLTSGCPFAVGTTAFLLGATALGSVLFFDESRFNLSHHDGQIQVFRRRGKVLLIIVSLRGTDFEEGVLWCGVALWAEGIQISLLCKATSMLKVTFTRFCSLKLFLSFKGMGLQY